MIKMQNTTSIIPTDGTMTEIFSTTKAPDQLDEDMFFNDGHKLKIIVYSILMVLSSIGNITVLTLLVRRRMRSPSRLDIMLTHLAIADLLVTFILMPLEIVWSFTVQWYASDFACRFLMFFRTFGLYLSSFVLVCISVDRYYAVIKPLNMFEHRGKIMLAIAWILSALFSAPQAYVFNKKAHPYQTDYYQCVTFGTLSPEVHLIYNVFCMVAMYAAPLLIIIFTYGSIYYEIFQKSRMQNSDRFRRSSINVLGRAKRRTLKMTITIVLIYMICWTPYYMMVIWFFIDEEGSKRANPLLQKALYLFAVFNSCANPVVYGIFNFKRTRNDRKNTYSFNYHSESKRRTMSTRTENFSRESSKTICINCGDALITNTTTPDIIKADGSSEKTPLTS